MQVYFGSLFSFMNYKWFKMVHFGTFFLLKPLIPRFNIQHKKKFNSFLNLEIVIIKNLFKFKFIIVKRFSHFSVILFFTIKLEIF